MFRQNTMPRYEILSTDAVRRFWLDKGWRRIVSEIGVQSPSPRAVELFGKAGSRSRRRGRFGSTRKLRPGKQVAAPSEFDVQARNPGQQRAHRRDDMVSAR